MSAFSTAVLALGESVLAYWPLEAGSGADSGPNANKEALTIVGSPAEGLPIVAGGGNSVVFDGVNVGASAAVPASGAGSQLNLTTAFSYFGWVAPSILPQPSNASLFGREGNQWLIGMSKTLGSPLFNVAGAAGLNLGVSDTNMAVCPQAGGKFTGPWPYFLCMTWDGNEFVTYINGRFSRQAIASPTFAKETKAFVLSPAGARFQGNMGHVAVINGALPAGVVRSLFLAGYLGTPPAFTDVFSYQADGIPATAAITPGSPSTVTNPGSPVVAISGAAVQQSPKKAPLVGYCAAPGCGGAIRSNEHYVTRTFTPGGSQPIHRSCYRVRGMNAAQPAAPASIAEITKACSRLMMDMTATSVLKSTDGKKRYLRINEGPVSRGTSAGSFRLIGTVEEGFETISGICPAMATLQRYYDLPRDSWCRTIAELVMDQIIAQRQWTSHAPIAANQDPYGCMVDDLTIPPTTANLNSANNDFFFRDLPMTLLLLWPWLSVTKRKTWTKALVDFADFTVGTYYGAAVPGAYFYINGNRNILNVLGMWLTYLVTGEQKWREHYELMWKLLVEPSVLCPAQQMPSFPVLNPKIVGTGNNLALGGSGAAQPFGQVITVAGTQADGSDQTGYLGESTGTGSMGPNGVIGPQFDGDYSQFQLEALTELYLWSGDARALKLANSIYNTLLPKLDKIGGKIPYRKPAIGSALGPTTVLAGGAELAAGATVLPANVTSGMAFVVGAKIQIDEGANAEELTIAAAGVTLGEPGSITVTTPTAKGHAVGVLLAETTANTGGTFAGAPWTYDAQRGSRHNAILLFSNPFPFAANWRGWRAVNPPSAEDLKGQWAAIDNNYRINVQSGAQLGSALNFRDMAHKLAVILQSDPAFTLPIRPGV